MAIKILSNSPKVIEYSIQEIGELATLLISMIKQDVTNIFGLKGELGAGKTTLIKEVARQLGVEGLVKSPTYSIQSDYEGLLAGGVSIQISHWDLYRISEGEAIEMYDEYLSEKINQTRVLFIEWAERVEAYSSYFTQLEISDLPEPSDNLTEKFPEDIQDRRIIRLKCPEIDK